MPGGYAPNKITEIVFLHGISTAVNQWQIFQKVFLLMLTST